MFLALWFYRVARLGNQLSFAEYHKVPKQLRASNGQYVLSRPCDRSAGCGRDRTEPQSQFLQESSDGARGTISWSYTAVHDISSGSYHSQVECLPGSVAHDAAAIVFKVMCRLKRIDICLHSPHVRHRQAVFHYATVLRAGMQLDLAFKAKFRGGSDPHELSCQHGFAKRECHSENY